MKTMKKKIKKTVNKKSKVKKVTKSAKKSFSKASQTPDIKTLGLLAAALVIVVLAALFVARLGKGNITENGAKNTTNQLENSEAVIKVPKVVSQCPKNFYEKTNGTYKIDAGKYPKENICQYYRTIKGTTVKIHNLQYNNEVVACRFFNENGETSIGETKYIHLGYEKKACTQGMYKN